MFFFFWGGGEGGFSKAYLQVANCREFLNSRVEYGTTFLFAWTKTGSPIFLTFSYSGACKFKSGQKFRCKAKAVPQERKTQQLKYDRSVTVI